MKMMGPVKGRVNSPPTIVRAVRLGEPFIVVTVNRLGVMHSIWRQQHQRKQDGRIAHMVSDFSHSHAVRLALTQFMAGAVGGGSATYATHWLDTIKVKMQANPKAYINGFDCLRVTLKNEGIGGLYKGATIAVAGNMTKASIVFLSYGFCEEIVRHMMGTVGQEMTTCQHASAGAMTGVTATLALCPMELIKCRMQALKEDTAAPRGSAGPVKVARKIIKRDGYRGLYRGLSGMWTKEIPGSFIFFGSYEFARAFTKSAVQEPLQSHKGVVFVCGMFAGLCFCLTHPIESVKTRVQVAKPGECRGFVHALCQILKNEGVGPLYSGLRPSMVRSCLFSGIQFLIYEAIKEHFLQEPS